MAFVINHRGGADERDPPLQVLAALYDEHLIEDDEHPSVSVTYEGEWCLSLYPDGSLFWEDVENFSVQPRLMEDVPKQKVVELWTKLAQGDIEAIQQEPWLPEQ